MGYLNEFLTVAVAEMRAARRLARTWLFIVLAVLLGVFVYVLFSMLHAFGSGLSASIGAFGPRYLIGTVGMTMVFLLVVGIVFLAFDVRARDARERMAEVLDSRPIGNVVLLAGRLAGLVFMLWLTVALVMGLIQLIGVSARALDWWVGDTIEPVSIVGFLVLDALPSLVFWGALVVLLAVVLRNRLLVALAALALFGLYTWSGGVLPYYLLRIASTFQATVGTGSDVLPSVGDSVQIVQRLCTVALGAGFVVLAAALHPRQDGRSRGPRLAVGGGLAALAVAGLVFLAVTMANARAERAALAAAHAAVQGEARDDLEHVRGKVTIDPGRRLTVDVVYRLRTASKTTQLLFSLNPGLAVSNALVDGTPVESSHEDGLLRVALPGPREAGERVELALTASGFPDVHFGYLDSELELDLVSGESANAILLGTDVSVFDRRYVALVPGGRWLPAPGSATGRDRPAHYQQDYFEVDLEVDVPDGWLVAGPGLRRTTENGTFRFAPPAPVPDIALLASRFDRLQMEVGGVVFELLLHPGHGASLAEFADALEVIEARVGEILAGAVDMGLAYPYDGFSLVEVPGRLRVFGGGWRMDTVRTQPGILMLRETGLPTARFDTLFRLMRQIGAIPATDEPNDRTGEIKLQVLRQFFNRDFSGGSLVDGVTRNFLGFQLGARGEGAIALDYVCHELAALLVHRGAIGAYFSPRTFASAASFNEIITQLASGLFTGGGIQLSMNIVSPTRASTWSLALGAPLATLDPAAGADQTLDLLALRAPAVAKSMLDGLGREAVGALLAELRRRHAGANYTIDDFNAAAGRVGADVDSLLGEWLRDASLPGFLASEVDVVRLADDEHGKPGYQIRLHVRNGEATPGLVRLGVVSEGRRGVRRWGDPVRVGAHSSVELGIVADTPPSGVWLSPYLSLNRRELRLPLPEYDVEKAADAEPFNGSRASDWHPPPEPGIVVDDLDAGFGIEYATPEDEARYRRQLPAWMGGGTVDFDQGLPVYTVGIPTRDWARVETPGAWGRYRRTVANTVRGDGGAAARFTTRLPHAGRWRIDYHVPEMERRDNTGLGGETFRVAIGRDMLSREKSDYDVRIVAGESEEPVEFDAGAALEGWNNLGEFSLPAGEVGLLVSNKTSGAAVIADAVRWRPVRMP